MVHFSGSTAVQLAVALAAALAGAALTGGGAAATGQPMSLVVPAAHQSVAMVAGQQAGTRRIGAASGVSVAA
jgi:hypothetical protein